MLPLLLFWQYACVDPLAECPSEDTIEGRVVDMQGLPLAGVTIDDGVGTVQSDAEGHFTLEKGPRSRWLQASLAGYRSRTRTAAAEESALIRLSEEEEDTVLLALAGDLMFARRFQDPDEDGDLSDGLVRSGHAQADASLLLEGIAPLLRDADFTAITLEGPLTSERSAQDGVLHPFRNDPDVAWSLRGAGVDVMNLATPHVMDFGAQGLTDTREHLTQAGLGNLGTGANASAAWVPLVTFHETLSIAWLGCTTLTEDEALFLATEDTAGVAACDVDAIRSAVIAARNQADLVVMELHGGWEYQEDPSAAMETYAITAIEAGAHLVIGQHPHVLQAVEVIDGHIVAWSMGNLLFDQNLWDTLVSAVLFVELAKDGRTTRAWLEPVLLDDYRPRGLRGRVMDQVAREIAGRSGPPAVVDDGAVELDLQDAAIETVNYIEIADPEGGWSLPVETVGAWITGVGGAIVWDMGRDLLLVGDFEDDDLDSDCDEGLLWKLTDTQVEISEAAAWSGRLGLHQEASHLSLGPNWSRPSHRIPVRPGGTFTVSGMIRGQGLLEVRMNHYPDPSLDLLERETRWLQPSDQWSPFALEFKAGESTGAILPELGIHPPETGTSWVDIDALRVIQWESSPVDSQRYDQFHTATGATLHTRRLDLP